MNGYNFSERVRKVLAMAREQAAALQHEYVGTEHILLGLLAEGGGVGATVLQNLGVDLQALSGRLLAVIKKGRAGPIGPDLPYTSRAKKALELSMEQARRLQHSYVGTEHLLLGLIAEEKGIAAQVLVDSGVAFDRARNETLRILGAPADVPVESESVPVWSRAAPRSYIHIAIRHASGDMRVGTFGSAEEAVAFIKQHDVQA